MDQIPPGHPTSWVPAGVPTTARYKEPGDVVPRFTLDMFKNGYSGALAVMTYYFDAVNWDAATGATPSIFSSFCPSACDQETQSSRERSNNGEHYSGGRYLPGSPTLVRPPASHHATWAGQFDVTVGAGRLVSATGRTVKTFQKSRISLELDASFNGKVWNVVEIYFVK